MPRVAADPAGHDGFGDGACRGEGACCPMPRGAA